MELIKVVFLSIGSAVVLFILTKIMGNKEISQLSMFDYIIGITIGSIAAEMSTALESDFMQPLVAMIIYAVVAIIISFLNNKSLKIRRFLYGKTIMLLDNGILYRKNFKKAKLDLNEFLAQCRTNGYFNINDIQTAMMEANGKISFLPKSGKRPATPDDINIKVDFEKLTINVILDGVLLKENLYATNHDEIWLQKQLTSQGIQNIKDIFLGICDSSGNLSLYPKEDIQNSHDWFE